MRRAALYRRSPILCDVSASEIHADYASNHARMNMQFKQFGRTGLSVSRLCLGTGTFGHQTGEPEAFRICDAAADAGVNFIDTANIYPAGALAHEVGNSEEITG